MATAIIDSNKVGKFKMKYTVTIFKDEEGWYVAECVIIPSCLSQGETQEEALENIKLKKPLNFV